MKSRIGNLPIKVPNGVEVTLPVTAVSIKGPKGILSISIPVGIKINKDSDQLKVVRANNAKQTKALHGTMRVRLANMITGVDKGFEKTLEIVGVGYRAQKNGNNLELALGYSHPVIVPAPEGIELNVEGQNKVIVKGIKKEDIGQMAAYIRKLRPPEPYKLKGIRYSGEQLRKKAGKSGKVGGK